MARVTLKQEFYTDYRIAKTSKELRASNINWQIHEDYWIRGILVKLWYESQLRKIVIATGEQIDDWVEVEGIHGVLARGKWLEPIAANNCSSKTLYKIAGNKEPIENLDAFIESQKEKGRQSAEARKRKKLEAERLLLSQAVNVVLTTVADLPTTVADLPTTVADLPTTVKKNQPNPTDNNIRSNNSITNSYYPILPHSEFPVSPKTNIFDSNTKNEYVDTRPPAAIDKDRAREGIGTAAHAPAARSLPLGADAPGSLVEPNLQQNVTNHENNEINAPMGNSIGNEPTHTPTPKKRTTSKKTRVQPPSSAVDEVVATWNRLKAPEQAAVRAVTDKRRKEIAKRLQQFPDLADWEQATKRVAKWNFGRGSQGWLATFDWLLTEKGTKAFEGDLDTVPKRIGRDGREDVRDVQMNLVHDEEKLAEWGKKLA